LKQKLYLPHAEIPVVEHCNMNCALCNSHAYLIKKSFYPFEQYKKDIDVLSKHIHFGLVTFMGGEPLLREDLIDFIAYAKAKKIGEIYRILTNGILVKSMSADLMSIIDVLEISHYPQMKETPKELSKYLAPLAQKYNFTFYIKEINYFNKIDTISLADTAAQKGYDNCMQRKDGCSIFNGHYYKCMRPKTTNLYLEKECGIKLENNLRITDSLEIGGEDFGNRLKVYLADTNRLEACKYCLMGQEKENSIFLNLKHKAYQHPALIKMYYKNMVFYHCFKNAKKIFTFDEGAHSNNNDCIKTQEHKVKCLGSKKDFEVYL